MDLSLQVHDLSSHTTEYLEQWVKRTRKDFSKKAEKLYVSTSDKILTILNMIFCLHENRKDDVQKLPVKMPILNYIKLQVHTASRLALT